MLAIYTLVSNLDQAKKIARALVSEKLAACANIMPNISSTYMWEGELQEESEVAMLLKTSSKLKSKLLKRLRDLHPYDVPAILNTSIECNSDYEKWIENL
ncbi:MAG: divalent-cation tolerance protein CutA [Deltaproteobacteria bacterium]|nr:divalent-cation tolerance protein CutA [Deltaproteobacteria bacterium]